MKAAFLAIRRLRILRRGVAVYDQRFHLGVNIIRGKNGSGKSTIADYIFFALGGEFKEWKTAARQCDEVQVEVLTRAGVLTSRRDTESDLSPAFVYFGDMDVASKHAIDGWQRFPIRRQPNAESYSQILFRCIGIPEAQSEGASNITMHQILRLMYSDQRTPAPRLFRFELFDTQSIREAVGQLMCGRNVYESYELQLEVRRLQSAYEAAKADLDSLLRMVPSDRGILSGPGIATEIVELERQAAELLNEIRRVDEAVASGETAEFLSMRKRTLGKVHANKQAVNKIEDQIARLSLDIEELDSFISYLETLLPKLRDAENTESLMGAIEFTHCPSCLNQLAEAVDSGACVVCGHAIDSERQQSRYLSIRLDIQTQLRESVQLRHAKTIERTKHAEEARRKRSQLKRLLEDFSLRYDESNSPRESYLAERHQKLGRLESDIEQLEQLKDLAAKIENLTQEKERTAEGLSRVRDRLAALDRVGETRLRSALTEISDVAVNLLRSELERQDEFMNAEKVELAFANDAILVDGAINFAESSNVILKNTAILSLLSASCSDLDFYYPRFALFDNIEDKGMEPERSYRFQSLIVETSDAAQVEHQIIFTTSAINPALENERYVIGPRYDKTNRTLDFRENENENENDAPTSSRG